MAHFLQNALDHPASQKTRKRHWDKIFSDERAWNLWYILYNIHVCMHVCIHMYTQISTIKCLFGKYQLWVSCWSYLYLLRWPITYTVSYSKTISSVGVVAYLSVTFNTGNTLWMTVKTQIYSVVPYIYDLFIRSLSSLIHSSCMAVTHAYTWYVTVTHNVFSLYI